MKRKNVFLGLLVFTFAFSAIVSCDTSNSSSATPETVTYNSIVGDTTYTLTVTQNPSRATYRPATGDTYVLTITKPGSPPKTSNGTVTVSTQGTDTVLALSNGIDLKVTVSSSGNMTRIEGTITTTAGSEDAPGEVVPETPAPPVGNSVVGTWRGSMTDGTRSATYTFTFRADNTFTGVADFEDDGEIYSDSVDGTYSMSGNTIYIVADDEEWDPVTFTGNSLVVESTGMILYRI